MTSLRSTPVRGLADAADHAGTVSLYLNVDGHTRPRLADCENTFDSLAHQARIRASGLGEAVEASVRTDLKRMRSELGRLDRSAVRGLAFFACHAAGRFDAVRLPIAVDDDVTVGDTAHLGQLDRVMAGAGRTVVALVDREHARIFDHALGVLTLLEEQHTPGPRRHDQGGWSASSIQRHTDELGRRHLAHAAARVEKLLGADPSSRLVVGGPEADVAVFIDELRPDVRRHLVGRVSVRVGAGQEEVSSAVRAAVAEATVPGADDPVEALRSAIGTGMGVSGLASTLEALSADRCAMIVTPAHFTGPGWKCPGCGRLSAAPGACPCGARLEEREDIAPAMTVAALHSGCRLAWVDDSPALESLGGIGAVLRF